MEAARGIENAGGFLAAADGRQSDVLAAVAADDAVKEPATTRGPQIFPIACSPDGKRLVGIASERKRAELFVACVERPAAGTMARLPSRVIFLPTHAVVGPNVALSMAPPSPRLLATMLLRFPPGSSSALLVGRRATAHSSRQPCILTGSGAATAVRAAPPHPKEERVHGRAGEKSLEQT